MAVPSRAHQTLMAEATYVLRLVTNRGEPVPVPGHPIATDGLMALMLPPQALRPTQAARVGIMESRAGAIVDEQGMSPPSWDLSGQFRLAPTRVGTVILDHPQQQRALEDFVRFYLSENKRRALARDTLISMEFHDFYADEHWRVVPLGVPLGERDMARPTAERWSLRLRGLTPTTTIDVPEDAVASALAEDPNRAVAGICPHEAHQ